MMNNIESQPQKGPQVPDFVFTISPKTEGFLNSIDVFVDGVNLIYLKNNLKIPIMHIPEISEGSSNVRVEQVGDTRKLRIDYNNGNGDISRIIDLDVLLREDNKTNS